MPAAAIVVGLLLALAAVPGAAIAAEMQAVLDKHNVYRCMHDVPLFTWDAAIAANAQTWADRGIYEHSAGGDRTVGGQQSGENIAWGSPTFSGAAATVAWYSEVKFTEPYGTADSMTDAVPSGEPIGHYTQIVWRASTKLGCGKGTATVSGASGDFWVCQYGPAGNYVGQFSAQVVAPTVSVATCGGVSGDLPTGGTAPAVHTYSAGNCHRAPADRSRQQCETCFHGDQCVQGFYCCPYMKKCVNSPSMPCLFPIADCSPMCYDSSCDKAAGCNCPQCHSRAKGDWLAWATQLDSSTQSPAGAPCNRQGAASGAGRDAVSGGHLAIVGALTCGIVANSVGA